MIKDRLFLNVNKPRGVSSFFVIKQLREILGIKKIGHLGTLDPLADGVLPIAVGKATKLISYLQGDEKEYIVKMRFGATSDTLDAEGKITENDIKDYKITEEQIRELIPEFLGEQEQVPPRASALKVNGKRAYELQRDGKEFKLTARAVNLYELELIDFAWPYATCRLLTGKGYYVRSFVRDLGDKLEVGAYVTDLKRTKVGGFVISEALTVDEIRELLEQGETLNKIGLSIERMWEDRPRVVLNEDDCSKLLMGQFVEFTLYDKSGVLLTNGDTQEIVGLVEEAKVPGMIKLQAVL